VHLRFVNKKHMSSHYCIQSTALRVNFLYYRSNRILLLYYIYKKKVIFTVFTILKISNLSTPLDGWMDGSLANQESQKERDQSLLLIRSSSVEGSFWILIRSSDYDRITRSFGLIILIKTTLF
jgi:hypothetical protein